MIELFLGNTYSIFTQSSFQYNYTWIQPYNNYLTFKVRTCNDAHILLSNTLLDTSETNSYEIVFGAFENTRTVIRQGSHGNELAAADTPDIMNCDAFLPLWVKWENSVITIGSGPLDSHVILQLNENKLGNIIATVTSWVTAPAEFQFLEAEGMLPCRTFFGFYIFAAISLLLHYVLYAVNGSLAYSGRVNYSNQRSVTISYMLIPSI